MSNPYVHKLAHLCIFIPVYISSPITSYPTSLILPFLLPFTFLLPLNFKFLEPFQVHISSLKSYKMFGKFPLPLNSFVTLLYHFSYNSFFSPLQDEESPYYHRVTIRLVR